MKHLRIFVTLLLLAVFAGVQAQDETIDFAAKGYTNAQKISETLGTDCKVTFTNGSTATAYYDTGTGIRIYGGGGFTVSAPNRNIAKLVFTFDGTNAFGSNGAATASVGTLDSATKTWTSDNADGDASVTITRASGKGHWRLQKIDVYYQKPADTRTPTTLTFATPDGYTYLQGEGTHSVSNAATIEPAVAGAAISYTTDNEAVATVDASGNLTVNDVPGTATITATFAGDDQYQPTSASYKVTVNPVFATIAELTAATTATSQTGSLLRLTNAQVLYANGNNLYLQDASGAILLYGTKAGYTQGQVLNGTAVVSHTIYNNLPEITAFAPNADLTVTEGISEPTEMSIADAKLAENYSKYIKMTGVTLSGRNVTDGNDSLPIYDTFKAGLPLDVEGTFDIVAIPTVFKTTNQLSIISISAKQTIGESGYATLYYSNAGIVVPEGIKAATYHVTNGALAEGVTYAAGDIIPSGEAVVLQGTPATYTFAVAPATAVGTADASNQLKGTDVDTQITADTNSYFYMLSLNSAGEAGSIGFYWGMPDGSAFNNKAHKAYLTIAKTAGAKNAYLFGEATAISLPHTKSQLDANAPMYNLSGQRVNQDYRGVVIQNGKKHLVK